MLTSNVHVMSRDVYSISFILTLNDGVKENMFKSWEINKLYTTFYIARLKIYVYQLSMKPSMGN